MIIRDGLLISLTTSKCCPEIPVVSVPVAVLLTYFYAALIGAIFLFMIDVSFMISMATIKCVELVQSSEFMAVSAVLSWTGLLFVALFRSAKQSRNLCLLRDLLADVATPNRITSAYSQSTSEPGRWRFGAILIACLHAGICALEAAQSQSFMARVVWTLVWFFDAVLSTGSSFT